MVQCVQRKQGNTLRRGIYLRTYRKIWILIPAAAIITALLVLALAVRPWSAEEPEPEPEQVTITLVYPFQNRQWSACVEEVVRQFEYANPGIHVSYEIRYEDELYDDTLTKLVARDELGDIVQLKEPYAFAENGLLAPLPDELAGQVDTVCRVDNRPYAVAAVGATTGVVYNKALFARYGLEPPESYQDFLALCAALRRRGITPLGVGGGDLWHMEYWMNHFLRSDVLSREPDFLVRCAAGERDWNDPLITEMLAHMSQLFLRGYVDDNWPSTPDTALAYHMAEGEVAMVFSGPWLISDTLALDPEMELGWFYVPNEDGQVVAGDSEDVFWAVTAGCAENEERYQAAVTFLEFFYSGGVYEQLCRDMAGYSTLADEKRGKYPVAGAVADVITAHENADLRFSAYIGDENTPAGFEKQLLSLLKDLCRGGVGLEEAQALADRYWKEAAAHG